VLGLELGGEHLLPEAGLSRVHRALVRVLHLSLQKRVVGGHTVESVNVKWVRKHDVTPRVALKQTPPLLFFPHLQEAYRVHLDTTLPQVQTVCAAACAITKPRTGPLLQGRGPPSLHPAILGPPSPCPP
jgi:hypothetical protein